MEEELKIDIYEYLIEQNKDVLQKLYMRSESCLAVFRMLNSISKHIIMCLLSIGKEHVLLIDIIKWFNSSLDKSIRTELGRLSKLQILSANKDKQVSLNKQFSTELMNSFTGKDCGTSFADLVTVKNNNLSKLILYGNQKWESILHFMVGTSGAPDEIVVKQLVKMRLMKEDKHVKGNFAINNLGFRFLLLSLNHQIWCWLIGYTSIAVQNNKNCVDVLKFWFWLSSLEFGKGYTLKKLTPLQNEIIQDMKKVGLIFIHQKERVEAFFPTHLSTSLLTFNNEEKEKYIIVETNYRVYAYTNSPLKIAILNLFIKLQCRFPNMVQGCLERDKVRSAFTKGITANQIIQYLISHAHPNMLKNNPILPLTVIDQIKLWEMEKKRTDSYEGFLYYDFPRQQDFDHFLNFVLGLQHVHIYPPLIWHNSELRQLFIYKDYQDKVSTWIKNKNSGN